MSENDINENKDENKTDIEADKLEQDVAVYVNKEVFAYRKKKKHRRLIMISSLVLVMLACVAVYISGVRKSINVFDKTTIINGVDVSGKTVEEARELLLTSENAYHLDVHFKNGDEQIRLGDGGLSVLYERDIQEIFDGQNPYQWPVNIGRRYNYVIGYSLEFTDEDIKNYIDTFPEMDIANMLPSKDAVVTMEDGEVKITSDEEGTKLNKEKVYKAVFDALSAKEKDLDVAARKCYIAAKTGYNSKYVKSCVENGKRFLGIKGVYLKDGAKIVELTPDDLCKMGYFDENGKVEIDYNSVSSYIKSIAKYFPPESAVSKTVTFITHKGIKKNIATRTTDWVFDITAETEKLYEQLQAMSDFERTPRYKSLENAIGSEIEIEDTYLEIDLGEQHVFLYKKGEAVYDTLCVSGCVAWGTSTPAGLFVMGKPETNARLVGEGNSYDTRVAYWMPFINQEIGLHDASWKTEFGGDIYKYNGSHGCINLSSDAAKTLFGMVYQGMPVVVYY